MPEAAVLDTACCIQEDMSGNASNIICVSFNKRRMLCMCTACVTGSGNVLQRMPH